MTSYLTLSNGIMNLPYFMILNVIGQSVVALFLFYSGYAMMLSGMSKGKGYIKNIPVHRILKVLFNFDIAVLLFLILQTILGKDFSAAEIFLSFIGWESLGNSNWYIFAILVFYLITYVAFIVGKDNKFVVISVSCVLIAVYIILMHKFKDFWWYDTALCYIAGMVWYCFKDKLEQLFKSKDFIYWISLVLSASLYVLTVLFDVNTIILLFRHVFFAVVVVLVTMKVSVHNSILEYLGKHLFSIYILQRLPMILLLHLGINKHPILFIVISMAVTLAISYPFDLLIKKLDKMIFTKKL